MLPQNINDDQLRVYQGLKNMQLKIIITYVILGAFVAILIVLLLLCTCIHSTWQDKTILAVLDLILGGTMLPVVNHFFPAFRDSRGA